MTSSGRREPRILPAGERSAPEQARYDSFAPGPEFAPWIARLWVQEAPACQAPPTTVVPNGEVELIVCFGDPFVHLEEGRVVPVPAVMALGQRTRPLTVAATGATGLVIAGLHPWAADALLGDVAGALTDRIVDLADLLGHHRVARLHDRVGEASGPEARARVVESFLGSLFRRHTPDFLAALCTGWIVQKAGRVCVDGLATELGVSGRHLRRRVLQAVGLGPKRLARLARAQRALAQLRQGHALGQVATECGYGDQAHLSREIKTFSGRTPGTLRGTGAETPLKRAFNDTSSSCFSETVYL